MSRRGWAIAAALALPASSSSARADVAPLPASSPASSASTAPPSSPPVVVTPVSFARGVAVVALDGATDLAWPLASAVYGDPALAPVGVDDATARVLAGESPKEGAPPRLRDLSDLRRAVHGDDAPSRRILASIGAELGVSALAVVSANGTARVFAVSDGSFGGVTWAVENGAGARTWSAMTAWMHDLATKSGRGAGRGASVQTKEEEKGAFLSSAWFWGAIVAAGALGAGAYAIAKSSGGEGTTARTVPLELRISR